MPRRAKNTTSVDDITAFFASAYISSNGRLLAYQQLCRDLYVDVGASITQCKQNIKSAHVNIHDFVRVQQSGGDMRPFKFRSYKALRQDIFDNPSRRFPLWKAKQSEFIGVMLVTT